MAAMDLALIISPARFRLLADWIDHLRPDEPPEVQDDLRRFADALERATDEVLPIASTDPKEGT